ncbi:MAG: HAMP domain-containing histidine kinase [Clostridia bacterium]|nr:HAMP domain-containing histidine kinase [Clostridia bacterium]
MRSTLWVLLLFSLIYGFAQIPSMARTIRRVRQIETGPEHLYTYQQIREPGVAARWMDEPFTGAEVVLKEALDSDLLNWPPILDISVHKDSGTLVVSFDLTERLEMLMLLLAGVLLLDVLRIAYFMRNGNRLNQRVLRPIREMTDTAATLGAGNLSNRINIAGTKNELKDLAQVINHMLDRIELSYNSQKQFVSDASHELRTPIAVIQGYANMLERWGKEDKEILDEGIRAITQETASMKELVDSLLFLARHDKRTLLLEVEAFDPCEVMADLYREATMLSPGHTFHLDPLEHCFINADKKMVKQVMRILCDNAIKYTPLGGAITLSARKQAGGCQLSVADTGPGISKEELGKVFDRFYRAATARRGDVSGHGLGLSIARIIVIAHKGEIKVRSKVGKGTIFTVFLPE